MLDKIQRRLNPANLIVITGVVIGVRMAEVRNFLGLGNLIGSMSGSS